MRKSHERGLEDFSRVILRFVQENLTSVVLFMFPEIFELNSQRY